MTQSLKLLLLLFIKLDYLYAHFKNSNLFDIYLEIIIFIFCEVINDCLKVMVIRTYSTLIES